MTSLKEQFSARFGPDQADAIEAAAEQHRGYRMAEVGFTKGSDSFRWALVIAIGYECFELYGESHGITAPPEEIKQWIKDHAHLEEHDGDYDGLAMFIGKYAEYMPERKAEDYDPRNNVGRAAR